MNHLDLLPDDVVKIINREVQKAHITKRRIERKQSTKINRDQREKQNVKDVYTNNTPDYIINILNIKKTKNTHKELINNINTPRDYIRKFLKITVICFYIQNNVLEVMNHI